MQFVEFWIKEKLKNKIYRRAEYFWEIAKLQEILINVKANEDSVTRIWQVKWLELGSRDAIFLMNITF